MKRLLLLILLALFLFACHTERKSTGVRYPDPPNQPPRIPSEPAVIVDQVLPNYPDEEDEENKKGRKDDNSSKKPTRDSNKDKEKDKDKDRNRK